MKAAKVFLIEESEEQNLLQDLKVFIRQELAATIDEILLRYSKRKEYYTIAELAEQFCCSKAAIHQACKRLAIPKKKLPGSNSTWIKFSDFEGKFQTMRSFKKASTI